MPVYNTDGIDVNYAYNAMGMSLSQVYSLSGQEIIIGDIPEYGIENVESYFRSKTLSVAEALDNLSSDWQSFIFVTDSHQSNYWHSAPIAMYLLANANVKQFFHGGDCIGGAWSDADYLRYFTPMITNGFTRMIYPVVGNHELILVGDYTYESLSLIYDTFLSGKNLHGHPDKYYYYFDNVPQKTRYLFINTSDTAANRVTSEQIGWLSEAVYLPSNTWNLVVIGHIDIDPTNMTGEWKSWNAQAVMTVISGSNGHIVGYFCGHEHIDQLRLVNSKFFQCICLCDVFENSNYFNVDNYPVRTAGTNTEQVVTVVSFNTTTGEVVTRRIGAGDEYAWNYKTLQTA